MLRDGRELALLALAASLFAFGLFRHLGHPVLWADEAETAMFAQRIAEYGYPKVHGDRNVVYQFGPNIAVGVKEGVDAYIGTTWGHFYAAVPGVLWARSADDPEVRTRRLRLPFALAGAAGVGLWIAALAPAVAGGRARRLRYAAAFLLLGALCVSLVLHLREVRYYALVVLLGGAILRSHLAYAGFGREGRGRWALQQVLLLFLLYHCFFQAFFAFAALLAAERALAAWRGRADWRDLAPFAAVAVLVAPFVVWFETFSTARRFADTFSFSPARYVSNLATLALHLLRFEFLAPALAARAAALAFRASRPDAGRVAGGLLVFAAGFVALGALNPLPLERYFIVLSPLLLGVFLIDAFALLAALPLRAAPDRRRAVLAATLAALVGGTLLLRLPALPSLRGRAAELATPVRGPLDFALEALRARYPDPASLVIATNYEECVYMYYLDSHVIVGLSLNNLGRERDLEPDVVVPRRGYPRSLAELEPYLRRGVWRELRLPVADQHANNVPSLSASRFMPTPHRFETPATSDPEEQLVLYLRAEPDAG